MPAIRQEFGWTTTVYALFGVVCGLLSVAFLPLADKIYSRYPVKIPLLVSVILYEGAYLCRAYLHSWLGFCLIYALIGITGAFILYVPVPVLIHAWFRKRTGLAIGLVMLSSGLVGAAVGPAISSVIQAEGWRHAAIVLSLASSAVSVPLVLLLVRSSPEECGLCPYGTDEKESSETSGKTVSAVSCSSREKKTRVLICFVLAMLLNLLSGISQHLANFASVLGLGAAVGAGLTTACMIGNVASKAILGPSMDRFGKKKPLVWSLVLVCAGYAALALSGLGYGCIAVMYAAAAVLGITAAHNTMAVPECLSLFASGEEYTHLISRVSMGTMLASGFINLITGGLMDLTGSYSPVFFLFAALEAVCILLLNRLLRRTPAVREKPEKIKTGAAG